MSGILSPNTFHHVHSIYGMWFTLPSIRLVPSFFFFFLICIYIYSIHIYIYINSLYIYKFHIHIYICIHIFHIVPYSSWIRFFLASSFPSQGLSVLDNSTRIHGKLHPMMAIISIGRHSTAFHGHGGPPNHRKTIRKPHWMIFNDG